MTAGQGSSTNAFGGAVSYRIDPARRLITITYDGPVTFADIVAVQRQGQADPAFDPAFAILFDGMRGDFSRLTAEEMKTIARSTPVRLTAPRAFVMDSAVNYGLARMFTTTSQMDGRGFPARFFGDRDEALRWLASMMGTGKG